MATVAPRSAPVQGETRFFAIMAFVMSGTIVSGFAFNLAMGRSTFAVPPIYHIHAFIFMSWIALYLAQHVAIARGNVTLHVRLGKLAYLWIPAMVLAGSALMITVARRNGGPFFFAINEFLISNLSLLFCFAGLALWALRQRRYTGWHRRLMLCAMAILTGPGIGRLLPLPLMIPYAWTITFLVTLILPVIALVADKHRNGRVHPAFRWGIGIYVGVFVCSMLLAYSPIGYAITDRVIAGSAGAARPMQAFLPPGFKM